MLMTRIVMKVIGVAELKSRLSEYLAQVKAGEEVLITDRGAPVAKLVRTGEAMGQHMEELVRRGIVKPGTGKLPPSFFDEPKPEDKDGSVLEALIEERRSGR